MTIRNTFFIKIKLLVISIALVGNVVGQSSEFWVPYRVKDSFGYADLNGKMVLPAKYANAGFFNHWKFAEIKNAAGNLRGRINEKGEILLPPKYNQFQSEGDFLQVREGDSGYYYLFTEDYKLVAGPNYYPQRALNNNYIITSKYNTNSPILYTILKFNDVNKLWNSILTGETDYEALYFENTNKIAGFYAMNINTFYDTNGIVTKDAAIMALYQKPGENTDVLDEKYDGGYLTSDNILPYNNKNNAAFQVKQFRNEYPNMYDTVIFGYLISNPFFYVLKQNKWGVVNDQNKILVSIEWDSISTFYNDYTTAVYSAEDGINFYVEKNNKWGIANTEMKDKPLIACAYDSINQIRAPYILVYQNGLVGYIHLIGKRIINHLPTKYNSITQQPYRRPIDNVYFLWVSNAKGHYFWVNVNGVEYYKP